MIKRCIMCGHVKYKKWWSRKIFRKYLLKESAVICVKCLLKTHQSKK